VVELEDTIQLPPVLLVDDKPANLLALEAVLSTLDLKTVAVKSGREALEHIEHQTFAVAVVDVQMPEMDGFELTRRLRKTQHGRELPILLVTAIHRDEAFARQGYASGAADYITKPYDPQVMRARVNAFIDLYRQRETIRRGQVALRTQERDEAIRRLVAFERIATAVLETNDLGTLLAQLLGAFIGAADAADSATILLRDGDYLRVAATVGSGPDGLDAEEVRIGEGFAGLIALERRPLEITEDESSKFVQPALPEIRALYGIPLFHAGQVLGVAHIGSTRAGRFTASEKRLLYAAAERAALAVAKQLEISVLNEVLEAAPAYIAIVGASTGDYVFANHAMRQLFSLELVGKRFSQFGLGADAQKAIESAVIAGKTVEISELRSAVDAAGPAKLPAYMHFTAQPLRNVSGTVDRVLVFATDIALQVEGRIATEQAQAAHERLLERERAARLAAESASTAKDEFLATVSHELRTPLNAILGWAAMARARPDADKERALSVIERNARAQARIVEDVVDFSRMSKGKMRLTLRRLALREIIDAALESVRPAAEAKNIALNLDLQLAAPIVGDADRLQQVIWNLLSNAVKFSGEGGSVAVQAASSGSKTTLVVTDQGQGIDPEFLPHVFEPFRQANGSTTRRHGGLGLGLAIVRQIVQAHGGTIEARSEGVGKGATFFVELPIVDARPVLPVAKSNPEAAHAMKSGAVARLDGLRVMVVDDEEDSRDLLGQALSARGAEVIVAASAREALKQLEELRPDVLVSDVAMPDIDGYEFVRRVRSLPAERGGRTPAMALTAHAGKEALERALRSGFHRYASKPVDLDAFVETVAELGSNSRAVNA
jgi:signal transduction histidine kinase/DNA-binding response OmpR family regulator